MGPQRPHLVGLICWIMIIGGFGGLVLALKSMGAPTFAKSMALFPYPPAVAEGLTFGLRALMVLVGIFMYERQGWARYPYLVIVPLFLAHYYLGLPPATTLAQAHNLMLHKAAAGVGFLFYLLSIVVLFLPATRRYYHPPLYVDE